MKIAMSSPDVGQAEIDAVTQVLRTPHLSMGPSLKEFEKKFASYVGRDYGVAVSSGTAGLHLALIAAGIEEGDLVITTPFSFIASANAILYQRAVPIFVDVDERTGNLDPTLVTRAVEDLAEVSPRKSARWLPPSLLSASASPGRLKALLPVHVFGEPAEIAPITRSARLHGLVVIEDACEGLGGEFEGQRVGSFGDLAVFAFYPNKQMTTGEGGVVVTDDERDVRLLRSLRNQGRASTEWLQHAELGYNYRLDEMSASLGVVQLRRIDELLERRARVASWYTQRLNALPDIRLPETLPHTTRRSWFVYVIRLPAPTDRASISAALHERGVPSRPYFPSIHLQPFYVRRFGYRPGTFPVAERLAQSCLALPFSGVMTEEQVDYVCSQLRDVLKSQRIA